MKMNRKKVVKFLQTIVGQKWVIGFTETPISSILAGEDPVYHWAKNPYNDRWFADPFLLECTCDRLYVLCEEYRYETEKGRIAQLTIDRKTCAISDMKIVLELDSHLSFPYVTTVGNKVYVCPENGRSGTYNRYVYDKHSKGLTFNQTILSEPLADAVPLESGDSQWIFATKTPHENGPWLYVYKKDNDCYREYSRLHMGMSASRMGGGFFRIGDRLYRVAQDCSNGCYGHRVIIQEAKCIDGQWTFENVRVLSNKYPLLEQGFHTFNVSNGIVLVDKRVFRHSWIALLLEPIKGIFLKCLG